MFAHGGHTFLCLFDSSEGADGAKEVVEFLDEYGLSREDVMEVSQKEDKRVE